MSERIATPLSPPYVAGETPRAKGQGCGDIVAGVLRHAAKREVDHRRWTRQEYHEPILLLPVDPDGTSVAGRPVVVDGVDISMAGLSFKHDRPFQSNHFVAGLRDAFGNVQPLLVTVRWTRLANGGGYVSGGRFLKPSSIALPDYGSWEGLATA